MFGKKQVLSRLRGSLRRTCGHTEGVDDFHGLCDEWLGAVLREHSAQRVQHHLQKRTTRVWLVLIFKPCAVRFRQAHDQHQRAGLRAGAFRASEGAP